MILVCFYFFQQFFFHYSPGRDHEIGAHQHRGRTQVGRTSHHQVLSDDQSQSTTVSDRPHQDTVRNISVRPVQIVVRDRTGGQRAAKTGAGHRAQSVAALYRYEHRRVDVGT